MILSARGAAWFTIVGVVCDALGGLYLACDIFKRHSGPLGLMTRFATYSVVIAIPQWLALGPAFGVIAGIGCGALISFDNWMLARRQRLHGTSPLAQPVRAGLMRDVVVGVAAMPRFGWQFGLLFMVVIFPLTLFVYGLGYMPTYRPYAANRSGVGFVTLRGAVLRSLIFGAAAAIAAYFLKGPAEASRIGEFIAVLFSASMLAVALILPAVEYKIEHATESFFIFTGLTLITCGLICDIIPSIFVLLTHQS